MSGHPDPSAVCPTEIVRIQYAECTIAGMRGQRLLDAILDAGIDHRHVCGGNGFCTSCRVEILDGSLSEVSPRERERLGGNAGRLRLACQAILRGDVKVRVPAPLSNRFSPHGE